MIVGVLKEQGLETRVSLLPEHVGLLSKLGISVMVQSGAGMQAFAADDDYVKVGATIHTAQEVLNNADVLLLINRPKNEQLVANKVWIGQYFPLQYQDVIADFNKVNAAVFSLDLLPRTTRAQSMDVLSSQANIAGYKAVLTAAAMYPRYFPMFMTAAGSIPPAKVLILGAGVAGLQAIATAKRLGAVVEVFDTRPAVKEEVMSLGAKFIEVEGAADASKAGGYAVEQSAEFLQKQKEKIAESVKKADIIITTAQIPGKKAPELVSEMMVQSMRSGSVIIDLAASTGGNTPLTKDNETVLYNGISIVGNSQLAATLPSDASKVYGKNICNFIQLIVDKEKGLQLNFEDELVAGSCLTFEGKLYNERVQSILGLK